MSPPPTAGRDGRETILARIREATKASGLHTPAPTVPNRGRDGLPEEFPDRPSRVSAFARRMEELRVSFVLCDSPEDLAEGVALMAQASGWNDLAIGAGPLLTGATSRLGGKTFTPGEDRARLAACQAGLVECLAMDAQTGAILLSGSPEIAAAAPTLVILGTTERIAGSLDAAFTMTKSVGGGKLPASLMVLTGACITDIERRPIARGHGPQNLVVYLTRGA